MTTKVELTEPQSDHYLMECRYPLFVGGYGSGKSTVAVTKAIRDVCEFRAPIGCYSPTYDLLRLTLMPAAEEQLAEGGLTYTPNFSNYTIHVHGMGPLIFRSMSRPERIVGYEVFRSHVDEIDTLPKRKAVECWRRIMARNRAKPKRKPAEGNARQQISAYTTPEGYRFTYDHWKKDPGEGYHYVRAPTSSNPHNPEDYETELRKDYPTQLVVAYCDGHWTNLASGSIFPDFDREANGTKATPADFTALMVGVDFNVYRTCAVLWGVKAGTMHAVGEYVNLRDTPALLEILQRDWGKPGAENSKRLVMFPDASGKARSTTNATESDLTLIREAGRQINAPNANPLVYDRITSANGLICNSLGERRLFVNSDLCPRLVETLETIAWDDSGSYPKTGGDDDETHLVDAATYPVDRLYPVRRKPALRQLKLQGG